MKLLDPTQGVQFCGKPVRGVIPIAFTRGIALKGPEAITANVIHAIVIVFRRFNYFSAFPFVVPKYLTIADMVEPKCTLRLRDSQE